MEARTKRPKARRAGLVVGLCIAAALVGVGIYLGLTASRRPDPAAVEASLRSYVEGLASAGKLVLVEGRERVALRETTPGLLFGDSALGRFLGIRSDATVEASAWADLAFVIDLYATETWSIRYDPDEGGSLALAVPPLAMLTPAILTDTIEIRTVERSFFLDEARLEAAALRGLTARFVEAASAMIDDPELRTRAAASLEATARLFATNAGLGLSSVEVSFAPPED